MNRQQRRGAERARPPFRSLPGWPAASAAALSRWRGLFDAADVAVVGGWAPRGLDSRARLDDETIAVGALALLLTAGGMDVAFDGFAPTVDLAGADAARYVNLEELYVLLYLRTTRRPLFGEFAPRWAFVVGELDRLARSNGATFREGLRAAAAQAEGDA